MFGPSYLGIVQWAVATDPPRSLRALAAPISSARVRAFTYPEGTFSLESTLAWLGILEAQRHQWRSGPRDQLAARKRMRQAPSTLPLRDADAAATGAHVPF